MTWKPTAFIYCIHKLKMKYICRKAMESEHHKTQSWFLVAYMVS